MKITEDFSIKKINKEEKEVFKYDTNGKLTNISKDICAQVTKTGNKKIFMLKTSRGLKLYNPLNKSNSYNLDAKDKTTKGSMFKFREASEEAFNLYLQFLKTQQDSFLFLAERKLV